MTGAVVTAKTAWMFLSWSSLTLTHLSSQYGCILHLSLSWPRLRDKHLRYETNEEEGRAGLGGGWWVGAKKESGRRGTNQGKVAYWLQNCLVCTK